MGMALRKSRGPERGGGIETGAAESTGTASLSTTVAVVTRPGLFREVLCHLLDEEPLLRLYGTASDEAGARKLLLEGGAGVLLFDYESFGPEPEKVIARIARFGEGPRVLVLARRCGPETVERVLAAGAAGLVGKDLGFDPLVHAIQAVAAGKTWPNPHPDPEFSPPGRHSDPPLK
jgi:DNA-binding NarL/FixJ family response regulator